MSGSDEEEWQDLTTAGPASPSEGESGLTLYVVGKNTSSVYPLPLKGLVVIGRGDGCEIQIKDGSISRRHAALHLGARTQLEDLGSANGTSVSDRRLAAGTLLQISPGDVIDLGGVLLVLQSHQRLVSSRGAYEKKGPASVAPPQFVIEDEAMRKLHHLTERIAPSSVSVLLLGETGVGKEVLAEALHRKSPRADWPFLRLNCAALQESLFESELFGHERGAFTGAVQAKPGLLESAEGGTVFLDEVGELSLSLQAKLLRVIEERQILRVGGVKPRPIDVRLISATNRDLEAEVAAQRFRRDLFFRLNGIPLLIPPLRKRVAEIAPLARVFLADASRQAGRATSLQLAPEALSVLQRHTWPGNIRELRNVITRAVLLCANEVITPDHLLFSTGPISAVGASLGPPGREEAAVDDPTNLSTELDALERRRILDVVERCGGNQTRAAKELGISRNTLLSRLRSYGVRPGKP